MDFCISALNEALEKYVYDNAGKIPKDQVRAIDRDLFQQKVSNWISSSIAEKRKPGAQQKILQGFQELLADANESKSAGERQQKIAELNIEKHKPDLVINIPHDSASTFDFYKAKELIVLGESAAKEAITNY